MITRQLQTSLFFSHRALSSSFTRSYTEMDDTFLKQCKILSSRKLSLKHHQSRLFQKKFLEALHYCRRKQSSQRYLCQGNLLNQSNRFMRNREDSSKIKIISLWKNSEQYYWSSFLLLKTVKVK